MPNHAVSFPSPTSQRAESGTMKIVILAQDLWGVGGTVRSVFNLATGLAALRRPTEIELVSVHRRRDEPALTLPSGVDLVTLVDDRPQSVDMEEPDYSRESLEVSRADKSYADNSALTDHRILSFLQTTDANVIIGTRPSISLMIAKYAPSDRVLIAQEHSIHASVDAITRSAMLQHYGGLDAIVAVTEADARAIRDSLGDSISEIVVIPNSVPAPSVPISLCDSQLIMGAGRIVPAKRFDLLIRAFAEIADTHPDWNLRIYGTGRSVKELRRLIVDLGLTGRARMMGRISTMGDEWTKASIAVSASDVESFGMTLIEAMRAGVPLISTDCPSGPREIINRQDAGVLVPPGESSSLQFALDRLVRSPAERAFLAQGGLERSLDFSMSHVASAHLSLFRACARRRRRGRARGGIGRRGHGRLPYPARGGSVRKWFSRAENPGPLHVSATAAVGGFVDIAVKAPHASSPPVGSIRAISDDRRDPPIEISLGAGANRIRLDASAFAHDARWTISVEARTARHQPLSAGYSADARALLHTEVPRGELRHAIPYVEDGKLHVRAWKRKNHLEIRSIDVTTSGIRVAAQPTFEDESPPRLLLRRRSDQAELILAWDWSAHSREREIRVPGELFVNHRKEMHEDWDVFYSSPAVPSARVGLLLDDIPRRKSIDIYPEWRPEDTDGESQTGIAVRPYFTPRNNLAFKVAADES